VSTLPLQVRVNYANTITQIKRLLGRKFSEPEVQHEIANYLGYTVVPLENDEIGLQVRRGRVFSPHMRWHRWVPDAVSARVCMRTMSVSLCASRACAMLCPRADARLRVACGVVVSHASARLLRL
jgi:hypothetical protein